MNLESLLPTVIAEGDAEKRLAIFREHRHLLNEPVLLEIVRQGSLLAEQGETARALRAFTIGLEAAEAANLPGPGLTLLLRRAKLLSGTGSPADAAEAHEKAYFAAAALAQTGNQDAFHATINSAALAAEYFQQIGDAARGRAILVKARQLAGRMGSTNAELWLLRNLLSGTLKVESTRDWDSAIEYALEAERLLNLAEPGALDAAGVPPPDFNFFEEPLRLLTVHAYYTREDFPLSVTFARMWKKVAPTELLATEHLALAKTRSGEFVEAEALWREMLAITPDDPKVLANLAGNLSGQGKATEAKPFMDRAVALRPDNPQYRTFRIELRRATEDLAGAIADLDALIKICEAQIASQEAQPSVEKGTQGSIPAPQSRIQYERDVPIRDRLDLALLQRALLREKLGQLSLAYADLDRVADEADPGTAAFALRKRSGLLVGEGRTSEAIAALREALKKVPDDREATLELGTLLAASGEDEAAVKMLSRLILIADAAPSVVEAMGPLIARSPGNKQARAIRGLAAMTALRPSIALEDFSAFLEQNPENGGLHYSRGRARLMRGTGPGEEAAWKAVPLLERVFEATQDFARAVSLAPDYEEARSSLRWTVDRVCTSWHLHGIFLGLAHDPQGVGAVFPTLRTILRRFLVAHDLASQHEYTRAIEEWLIMQKEMIELDLPVSACRIDVFLADSLLRKGEVQRALDHLDRAEELDFLIALPMTRELAEEAQKVRVKTRQRSGREAFVLEQEFAEVYALFLGDMRTTINLLRIDALGRIGDKEGMLAVLDGHPEFETVPAEATFQGHVNVAARLRDNGEADRALALVQRLDAIARSPQHRLVLLNLRGSLQWRTGKSQEAEATFREALDSARTIDPGRVPAVAHNLARVLVDQNRVKEAREFVEFPESAVAKLSPLDRLTRHWVRAEVALASDEDTVALSEIQYALILADELRASFRGAGDRVFWQGRLVRLYELAIMIALDTKNLPLALEVVERTRSRAYLDLLQTRKTQLPESAGELVADLERLAERRKLLIELLNGVRAAGAMVVDFDLVRALEKVAPDAVVLQRTSSGRQALSPARLDALLSETRDAISHLQGRIDDLREAATFTAVGAVLDCGAIASFLESASEPARDGGSTADQSVVMAEYFEVRSTLWCLVMRAGESVPSLHRVDISLDELSTLAERAPWSDEKIEAQLWNEAIAAVVAPLRERSLPDELLWIVPAGALHQMPLHAAVTDGIPLLERNPICYSPSASVMSECRKRSGDRYSTAVVFGDSRGDLPFAKVESEHVAGRFGTEPHLGGDATISALDEALRTVGPSLDLLHLACHGIFAADDASKSGVELFGTDEEKSLLTAGDIVSRQIPAQLVTLSACVTARTRVFPGEEPVGLTRSFLSAGAASVVASLWLTNDLSTQLIIERFYDALLRAPEPNTGCWRKAKALREAALGVRSITVAELMAHPDERVVRIVAQLARAQSLTGSDRPFQDAYHWSPFVLVGDWG